MPWLISAKLDKNDTRQIIHIQWKEEEIGKNYTFFYF